MLTLSLSSTASRVVVGEEVEIFIAALTRDLPARRAMIPAGTRIDLSQRTGPGDGRLELPAFFRVGAATDLVRLRFPAARGGRLRLTAAADLPSTGIRVTERRTAAISHIVISSSPAVPPGGGCVTAPPTRAPRATAGRWTNWHGNISRDLQTVAPDGASAGAAALASLRAAVLDAESRGSVVGVQGTGWSYTECVTGPSTTRVIRTEGLDAVLTDVLPRALRPELESERSLFLHVEAGVKIHRLNVILEGLGLAMPTLGASRGQSLAGVISTGVHGSHVDQPPIADNVRALHIVGPGGQEWWLEPETDPVTDPLAMKRLRDEGVLCGSIRIVYDDDLFNAALVAGGCAGVIYAAVLKARTAYNLISTTRSATWAQAQAYIRNRIIASRRLPAYCEINVNPADMSCILIERVEVAATTRLIRATPAAGPDAAVLGAAISIFGGPAIATFFAAIGDYIARTTAEIAALNAIPVPGLGQYLAAQKTAEALDTVVEWHELLVRLGLAGLHHSDPQRVADLVPVAVNLIWKIGLFIVPGRDIVNQLQRMIIDGQRPVGLTLLPSYEALTGQPTIPADLTGYDGSQSHPPTERMIQSFEYGVPADRAIEFVERIRAEVARLRGGPDALIVNVNLRFTRRSRALIAMQQFDRTCHAEVYTVRGLDGNAAFHAVLERIAAEFGATPHWGQLHAPPRDPGVLFGDRLRVWQWAMNLLATAGVGTPNLFWSEFVRSRRLITFAPGIRAHPVTRRSGLAGSRAVTPPAS